MSKGEETNVAQVHEAFLTVMGKFYEHCAYSNVYEDSKTIVDMPLKAEPGLVMEEFGQLFGNGKEGPDLCEQDGRQLRSFIATWFMEAGSDTKAVSIPQRGGLSWGSELVASMLRLLRRVTVLSSESGIRSTLLPAPNPFIIPGERFRESYYWDSYWIILALLKTKDPDHFKVAEGIVGNFAYMVDTFGLVPNGFRSYYLNRSQPPMLAAMVHALYCHTKSPKIITTFLSVLKKELMFWRMSERTLQVTAPAMPDKTYVVSRYYANWTNPRPESLREDLQTLEELKSKIAWSCLSEKDQEIMEKQLFRDISAAAESGWDFSSRWLGPDNSLSSIRTTRILPADLNALLMKSEFLVSKMAAVVGDSDTEKRFQEFGLQRLAALQAIFWDEGRSKWRDVLLDEMTHTDIKTTSGFSRQEDYASDWVPLWCMEDAVEVNTLSKAVDSLRASVINAPGGIAASSIRTGQQWDWPNVWPPLQYFLAEGCLSASNLLAQADKERLSAEAENLAESTKKRFIHAARLAWEKVHTLPEKFDCQDAGACGSGGEYECVQGFGWTTGLVIHWLNE